MKELGILFLHYHIDEIVLNNLESVRRYNPNAEIVTMSTNKEVLPGGYSVDDTPKIKGLHSVDPYLSSDWLVCSWHAQKREACKKWWIVEWDVFCTMSVHDYYQPVWNFPFVASCVRLPYRDPEWFWFNHIRKLPAQYRPYAMGASPFIYLIDDHALGHICAALLKTPFETICEFRFATAANASGYPPCGYSPPGDGITWVPWKALPWKRGIFHPVKFRAIPVAGSTFS